MTLREGLGCIRGAELEVCVSSFSFGLSHIIPPLLLASKTVKVMQYPSSQLPILQFIPSPLHKNTNYIKKKTRANSTLLLLANTNFITSWLGLLHIRRKHWANSFSACHPSCTESVLYYRIKLLRAGGNIGGNEVVRSIVSIQTINCNVFSRCELYWTEGRNYVVTI